MKRWLIVLGFLISAVFVYLALRGLRLDQVWQTVQDANYGWVIPGLAVYFVGVWARTYRWHYMLGSLRVIPLHRLFPVVVIGYMGNNVYPARAGEVIRAYALRRKEDVPMSSSLATIIVERVFDGLVMLLFILISLPLSPMPPWLRRVAALAIPVFLAAMALFLALAASPLRVQAAVSWVFQGLSAVIGRLAAVFGRSLSPTLWDAAESIAARFLTGLSFLRSGRQVGLVFAISLLIWVIETGTYWCMMQGFSFRVPFHVLLLMNGVANLASIIPSSPGYVGTFDAPGIRVLEGFGVSGAVAAGYTLALHALLWLPITCLGFYYMWRESISWQDLSTAGEKNPVVIRDGH
jgi:uncharacterized protein (TIRG00374 family)